jgi:uncharacterized protein (DUF2249 family)
MSIDYVELDVRPILRGGGEPFEKIMQTVNGLKPGQGLRLSATFKPTPLLHVLGSMGFAHEARELGGGEWEVLFRPSGAAPARKAEAPDGEAAWPEPARHLDNRDLDPPEPMMRILAAAEAMAQGEVLSALLSREPIFLFPELAKRGHSWRGGFEADGATYKLLVWIGPRREAAA